MAMSSQLPQGGWYTIDEWAKALDNETPRTFRDKCRKYGIPRKIWGKLWIVKAEDFYLHLPTDTGNGEETSERGGDDNPPERPVAGDRQHTRRKRKSS